MKKLHSLVIRTYIGPFIATFFVAVFLLLMQFLWKYIDELVGKGLEIDVLGELMAYASATMVPMALPLAILLSSIMTFGNMGERYELVALKSSGVSLTRIMFPLIILTLIICYAAFLFSNNVLPVANLKMRVLLHDIRQKRPELDIKPGIFYDGIEGFNIKVRSKNRNRNMLYDLMIYDHTAQKGNLSVTLADSGKMIVTPEKDLLILTLWSGYSYEEVVEEGKRMAERAFPHRKQQFEEQIFTVQLEGFGLDRTDENLFKDSYGMMTIEQLENAVDSLQISLEERKTSFCESVLSTHFYRKEEKRVDSVKTDLPPKDSIFLNIDTDSLYASFSKSEKLKIVTMAANYARSSRTYVSTTGEDYLMRNKWIWKHQIAWHKKLSLSIACLVLFFVGAPLGAIIRKGGMGMPVVVSVILFIVYYVIDITGEKFAKEGVMPAYEGMWLSTITLFPLGFFLTYKAATDSAIMNVDSYLYFIQKLFVYKKLPLNAIHGRSVQPSYKVQEDDILIQKLIMVRRLSRKTQEEIHRTKRARIRGYPDTVENNLLELHEAYTNTYTQLISKYGNNSLLLQKFQNLPDLPSKIFRPKTWLVSVFILSYLMIAPGILIAIFLGIRSAVFMRKLRAIEETTQEIINILINPALLELGKSYENSATHK